MGRLRDWPWSAASAATFAVLALAYALLALSAYELFGALSIGVTFFPPAGLTLASFLLLPRRLWPAIAAAIVVGEMSVDLWHGQSLSWSVGWAAANLVEPLVGAIVVGWSSHTFGLNRRFFLAFLVGGLLAGPACGAAIGSTTLALANHGSWLSSFPDIWVGDALGALVIAPLVFVIILPRDFVYTQTRKIDIVVTTCALAAACVIFFVTDGLPVGYAAIPLLAFPAVRCSSRELSVSAVVVASALTAATARGMGPWAPIIEIDAHTRLVQQQAFLLAAIGAAWLLKLEVIERLRAVTTTQAAEADLERAREETKDKEDLAEMYRSLSERALEQAKLDHQVALTLQSALMPGAITSPSGIRVAGSYLPAASTLEVGGDWYEVIHDDEGNMTLVIGDVVGHSLAAAAAMGQLAAAARALACAGQGPASLIANLDLVATRTPNATMTTLVCATLQVSEGRMRYSCAGHPPPCVRLPSGEVTFLDGGRGTPLAVTPSAPREEGWVDLPSGSLVVFYTDGLVERRDHPIDDRLTKLRDVVGRLPADDEVRACDEVIGEMLGEEPQDDDVAVLLLALDASDEGDESPLEAEGLHSLRR